MPYAILGGLIGAFVVAVLGLASAFRVYIGASQRRQRNVSAEQRQPPAAVRQLLGELAALGFRRFGETQVVMPDTGAIGSLLGRQRRLTAWLMVDSPSTTLAEVAEIGPLVSLESWLADDTCVQTTTPLGEDIDEPGLRALPVKGSLTEAYTQHRLMVDARALAHGPPSGIHSMGDHLRHDALYRERFGRRYLRRGFITRQVVPTAVTLLALVVLAVLLLDRIALQ